MSADETIVKVRGKVKLVGFVADAASRRLLGTNMLVKRGSDGFTNWLKGYAGSWEWKALATDNLSAYKLARNRP